MRRQQSLFTTRSQNGPPVLCLPCGGGRCPPNWDVANKIMGLVRGEPQQEGPGHAKPPPCGSLTCSSQLNGSGMQQTRAIKHKQPGGRLLFIRATSSARFFFHLPVRTSS